MSVYPLTLGDIYVGIPFNLGRHICRLTSERVNQSALGGSLQVEDIFSYIFSIFT